MWSGVISFSEHIKHSAVYLNLVVSVLRRNFVFLTALQESFQEKSFKKLFLVSRQNKGMFCVQQGVQRTRVLKFIDGVYWKFAKFFFFFCCTLPWMFLSWLFDCGNNILQIWFEIDSKFIRCAASCEYLMLFKIVRKMFTNPIFALKTVLSFIMLLRFSEKKTFRAFQVPKLTPKVCTTTTTPTHRRSVDCLPFWVNTQLISSSPTLWVAIVYQEKCYEIIRLKSLVDETFASEFPS